MHIYDLSHTIATNMPVYPGTQPPQIVDAFTHDQDTFWEKKLTLFSHTGTHVDAPAHIIAGGKTLDQFAPEKFFGEAVTIKLCHLTAKKIEIKDLKDFAKQLQKASFCLLATGWSRYWGSLEYFAGFPVLSPAAAKWLAQFPLKGVGVDTISIDPVDTDNFLIHKTFLQKNILIIENLTNLESLPQNCLFTCLPLKIEKADGSPLRAAGIVL
ncbi:MAG: cyclase family protein [Firmicutes bacterium]|nr:cyclase family protein [Bacillota bacterium]